MRCTFKLTLLKYPKDFSHTEHILFAYCIIPPIIFEQPNLYLNLVIRIAHKPFTSSLINGLESSNFLGQKVRTDINLITAHILIKTACTTRVFLVVLIIGTLKFQFTF